MDKFIKIKGARTHNLKNIDLNLPKNNLITITGYQDQENHRSHLTQFLLRVKEDMLNLYPHMQDNSYQW